MPYPRQPIDEFNSVVVQGFSLRLTVVSQRGNDPASSRRADGGIRNRCYSRTIVSCSAKRSVTAVAVLAMAFMVAVGGIEWLLTTSDDHSHHGAHPLPAALSDAAAVTPHPHLSDGSSSLGPEVLAEAVLPRPYTALLALGVLAALFVMLPFWPQVPLAANRGPPRSSSIDTPGRVLLTRLCIARR